jgi:hypothetical protein
MQRHAIRHAHPAVRLAAAALAIALGATLTRAQVPAAAYPVRRAAAMAYRRRRADRAGARAVLADDQLASCRRRISSI